MSLPVSIRADNLYDTKDYKIIIFLLTMKLVIQKTVPEGRKYRFYFVKEQALPYVTLWNSGRPVPISDLHDVFTAIETFNSSVHDGVH